MKYKKILFGKWYKLCFFQMPQNYFRLWNNFITNRLKHALNDSHCRSKTFSKRKKNRIAHTLLCLNKIIYASTNVFLALSPPPVNKLLILLTRAIMCSFLNYCGSKFCVQNSTYGTKASVFMAHYINTVIKQ